MKINFDDQHQRDREPTPKSNPILEYLKQIWIDVPVLEKCYISPDKNHFLTNNDSEMGPVLTFIIRNEEYHLSATLLFPEWHRANLCILWQRVDYGGDIMVPLEDESTDYCHIGDFDLVESVEASDILSNHFIPLLKRFEFPSYYYNRNMTIANLN